MGLEKTQPIVAGDAGQFGRLIILVMFPSCPLLQTSGSL
jgi:hypothetical protein